MELALAFTGLLIMGLAWAAGRKKGAGAAEPAPDKQEDPTLREARHVADDLKAMLKLTTQTSEMMIDKLSDKIEEARGILEALDAGKESLARVVGREELSRGQGPKAVAKKPEHLAPLPKAPAKSLALVDKDDDQRERQVIGLQRAGYPPRDIAQMLNMGTGEVQLILSLNKKR